VPRIRVSQDRTIEAQRLRRLRDTLGFTQREMAREFKVAHGAIAGWESGTRSLPGPVSKLLELYEEELGLSDDGAGFERLETDGMARHVALGKVAGNIVARTLVRLLTRWIAGDGYANAVSVRAQTALARNLADVASELKGIAMKAGQTLGYVDFLLSESARAELSALMTSSPPLKASAVAQVFLEDQGQVPRQVFSEWSPRPFAAASIGQVHRARLKDGHPVAVKVQYPGVAEALESDLRGIELLDRLGSFIFRGQQRGVFMAELRERMAEECDYRAEAQHQEEFRLRWLDRPGVEVPRVQLEHCSRRILVSDFSEGESFEAFLERATAAERDRAGRSIYGFFVESFFRHGVFNADPHPGNFLFVNGSVVLLDFGCVKRLSPETVSWWRTFLRAYLERRFEVARHLLIDVGMIPDPANYDFDSHHRMVLATYEFCLRDAPFQFDPAFMQRLLNARGRDNRGKFRVNLPKDYLFAQRMALGMFALLARLEAKGDFRTLMLDMLYDPAELRPAPFSESELP
jgi:predicted unusual protein kinase regulating ubiquinone biosynthesis (AarF/ABC1/UbiB family)/DNA-binding XRE family transcriptional regulator